MSELSTMFKQAMEAIIYHGEVTHVQQLFNLVKDFNGINNRYGQIAVPDFLEYLAARLPQLQSFYFQLITKLQCVTCRWWSFNTTKDFMSKLYLPPKVGNRCTLFDILQFNSKVPSLSSVFCGRCDRKTEHSALWEHNAGILILEIVRQLKEG